MNLELRQEQEELTEFERGFRAAIEALLAYDPATETVRSCIHSDEWARYLESKLEQEAGGL